MAKRKDLPNYEAYSDSFAKKAHIASDLIWGNTDSIPEPWLSYTVPTYKRCDLLKETLDSIINQKEADVDWEIVVVDNEAGGENETEKMIRELNCERILYYRNRENLLVDGNVNRCIELARGKWIAMVHADDLLMSDHLREMSGYIREFEHKGKKPLAYISPVYFEFTDVNQVDLNWVVTHPPYYKGMAMAEKAAIASKKRLRRFRYIDALLQGASVYLPSNGTIMNRQVMLETGGFNDDFGICTDIIKPYTLLKHYRVYTTERPFGYYRTGHNNQTMKAKSVYDIALGCYTFSEYIYNKNRLTRLWGNIARDERFDTVLKYMMRYSRYGNLGLTERDFDSIHVCRKGFPRKVRQSIYKIVMRICRREDLFFRFFDRHMKATCDDMLKKMPPDSRLVICGAGRVGEQAVLYLKKHHPDIDLAGFAVTKKIGNPDMLMDMPVYDITELNDHKEDWYYLVSVVYHIQREILDALRESGFKNVFSIV